MEKWLQTDSLSKWKKLALGLSATLLLGACGSKMEGNNEGAEVDAAGHWILIGNVSSVLKKKLENAKDLEAGSEKCTLTANTKYYVQEPGKEAGKGHIIVNLQKMIPGCGFSKGYIYKGHIAKDSFGGAVSGNVRERALLDVIAYAEGTGDSYNLSFGHHPFSSYAWHPGATYCDGLCSNAAGRYQFLDTTWDLASRELGLGSFSPANQDKAALFLIHYRGVGNIANIDSFDEFSYAIDLMGYEWASLPNSPYGQVRTTKSELWNVYLQSVKKYSNG